MEEVLLPLVAVLIFVALIASLYILVRKPIVPPSLLIAIVVLVVLAILLVFSMPLSRQLLGLPKL